jgi:hypothetical protein
MRCRDSVLLNRALPDEVVLASDTHQRHDIFNGYNFTRQADLVVTRSNLSSEKLFAESMPIPYYAALHARPSTRSVLR